MFCKNCGKEIDEHVKFCPKCGTPNTNSPADNKAVSSGYESKFQLSPGLCYVILSVCALMLIVALSLALDAQRDNAYLRTEDLIGPIIFSILSLGGSGCVFLSAKKNISNNSKYKVIFLFALIVLILSIIMAVEVCLGPLIGEALRKR